MTRPFLLSILASVSLLLHYYNRFMTLCPGLHRWVSTYSGFCWSRDEGWQWNHLNHMQDICTSLQKITMPLPHQSDFYGPDALPDTQPIASKHWKHTSVSLTNWILADSSSAYAASVRDNWLFHSASIWARRAQLLSTFESCSLFFLFFLVSCATLNLTTKCPQTRSDWPH